MWSQKSFRGGTSTWYVHVLLQAMLDTSDGDVPEINMCLAGAVASVTDSDRCCNPKVPSLTPLAARTYLEQESLIT